MRNGIREARRPSDEGLFSGAMSYRHEPVAVGRLRTAFVLSSAILVAEVAGGLASHSLACWQMPAIC